MRAFVVSTLVIALSSLSGCGDGAEEAESVSASGGGLPTITITASGGSNSASASGGGTDSDTDGDTDTDSGAASAGSSDSNGADNSFKYDVAAPSWDTSDTSEDPCEDTGDDCVCTIPDHVPCDGGTNDPFQAMGLNCPG